MGTRRIKHRKSTRCRTVKLDPESMDMMQQQLQASPSAESNRFRSLPKGGRRRLKRTGAVTHYIYGD